MIGWLIYDEVGEKRNRWFIQSFIQSAMNHGIELVLKVISDNVEFCANSLPDFVIVRTINSQINYFFEAHGIPTFNSFETSKIANNKWLTYKLCQKLKIPTMKTQLFSTESSPSGALDFPFVLKSLNGHGGAEVFLIKNKQELEEKSTIIDKNNFLIQEFCSEPGRDMRVYALGDKVISGILRTSDSDFRSNFSLGGSVSVSDISSEQEEIVRKIHKELKFDFVGVDFIFHKGKCVLNEIEDVVGTRMLYKCTDIDIIDLYMRYIIKRLSFNL